MEKKLVKGKDRILAGVCSGFGEYLGWNTTAIRIAWTVLALCYGVGLVGYIVAAILMPEE